MRPWLWRLTLLLAALSPASAPAAWAAGAAVPPHREPPREVAKVAAALTFTGLCVALLAAHRHLRRRARFEEAEAFVAAELDRIDAELDGHRNSVNTKLDI